MDVGLAHHSQPAEGIQAALAQLYKVELPPDTPEKAKISAAVRARGTFAPDVITKGTMAFGLTFPNGFKVLDLDSAGPITEGDRTLAQKLGPVDVAIIAYQAHAVAERQVGETFPLVQLFQPKLYLPSHHDASFGSWIDLGIEPLLRRFSSRDARHALPVPALSQRDLRRHQRRRARLGGEVPLLRFCYFLSSAEPCCWIATSRFLMSAGVA